MSDTSAPLWHNDSDYETYVAAQVQKTSRMRQHLATKRLTHLVGLLVRADRRSPLGRTVLCIGCRNHHELRILSAAGFDPTGIDLISMAPGILPMDMHALTFPTASFDVVFSCHSLEHAYDLKQALREFARVTKPDGVWAIEVPVQFTPTLVDRHDLGSVAGVLQRVTPHMQRILKAETSKDGSVVRVICQKA